MPAGVLYHFRGKTLPATPIGPEGRAPIAYRDSVPAVASQRPLGSPPSAARPCRQHLRFSSMVLSVSRRDPPPLPDIEGRRPDRVARLLAGIMRGASGRLGNWPVSASRRCRCRRFEFAARPPRWPTFPPHHPSACAAPSGSRVRPLDDWNLRPHRYHAGLGRTQNAHLRAGHIPVVILQKAEEPDRRPPEPARCGRSLWPASSRRARRDKTIVSSTVSAQTARRERRWRHARPGAPTCATARHRGLPACGRHTGPGLVIVSRSSARSSAP